MMTQTNRPGLLRPIPFHYCTGCGHSILHRLIAEVIEDLGVKDRAVGVAGVGCSFLMYDFLDLDFASAPPGRAPSVATGLKRANTTATVFTYQGDTDAMGAGLTDLVHAATRQERITVFVVNNATTGLSGGHVSPATPTGLVTRTMPKGRIPSLDGHPVRLCELMASLGIPSRIERVALDTKENVARTRQAIGESLRHPLEHSELALLEILSPCPTHWNMSPEAALGYLSSELTRFYPLARFDRKTEEGA